MQVQKYSTPYLVAIRGKLFEENDDQTTIRQLQAKVAELENQLKSQKETVDKGNTLMKVIYGSKFDHEFLF